jgi:ABC-type sugar transport system permease subunit
MPLIILSIFLTLFFALLTTFIIGMVQLVGKGDNFWGNGIVQLDIILGIASVSFWVAVIWLTIRRKKEQ